MNRTAQRVRFGSRVTGWEDPGSPRGHARSCPSSKLLPAGTRVATVLRACFHRCRCGAVWTGWDGTLPATHGPSTLLSWDLSTMGPGAPGHNIRPCSGSTGELAPCAVRHPAFFHGTLQDPARVSSIQPPARTDAARRVAPPAGSRGSLAARRSRARTPAGARVHVCVVAAMQTGRGEGGRGRRLNTGGPEPKSRPTEWRAWGGR